MASLETNTIAATYVGLLKTSDSGERGAEGSADQCSDGAGNTIPLFVSATEVYAIGSGTGTSHTAFGKNCGVDLAAGTGNSLFGEGAGADITTGEHNVAVGYHALYQGTTESDDNVAIGYNAMSGAIGTEAVNDCVAVGSSALAGALDSTNGIDESSGTVAIGAQALGSLTTGHGGVAMGYGALNSATTVDGNTGIGYYSGLYTTGANNTYLGYNAGKGASGAEAGNTAVGKDALLAITDGSDNVAIGSNAMDATTTAGKTIAIGFEAASNLVGGTDGCVAIGYQALDGAVDGAHYTIAIGQSALGALTTGGGNVAIGYEALLQETTGAQNIAIGYGTMNDTGGVVGGGNNIAIGYTSMDGDWATGASHRNIAIGTRTMRGDMNAATDNTCLGYQSLMALTTGDSNMAIGANAGTALTTGGYNTMVGYGAGTALVSGVSNVAVGFEAFKAANADEEHNVCIGKFAGDVIDGGSTNVIIGSTSDPSTAAASNQIVLGYNATGVANNSVTLGNADVTDVYMAQDKGAQVHANLLALGGGDIGDRATIQSNRTHTASDGAYGLILDETVTCHTGDGGHRGILITNDVNITNSGTAAVNMVALDIAVTPVVLDSGSRTITNLASLRVQGAPTTSGGTITVTNGPYAMWVAGGESRFDGKISANAGVNFPDTQAASADANTLDDYEEGEIQPDVTCSGSGSYTKGNSRTYLAYTKIGRQVTLSGQIDITGESSPVGNLQVQLPFTVGATSESGDTGFGTGVISNHGGTMVNNCTAVAFSGGAVMKFFNIADDGTFAYIDKDDVDTAFNIHISITFIAA